MAVRWYLRYGLSYRDVEELLAERGVVVDHVTVYRWVQTFTAEFIDAARPCRHTPGDRWFVDETYVKIAGTWNYLYRPVDQHGQVVEVLTSKRRDLNAARAFFTQARQKVGMVPVEVSTDRAPAYPRVIDELLPAARHVTHRYANNTVESDHGRLTARLPNARTQQPPLDQDHCGSGTPSCRTYAAATTTSPPKTTSEIGWRQRSLNSLPPSDLHQDLHLRTRRGGSVPTTQQGLSDRLRNTRTATSPDQSTCPSTPCQARLAACGQGRSSQRAR